MEIYVPDRKQTGLIERTAAAESAIKRFAGKPLTWGSEDCLRLVAHALRELGFAPPLRQAGRYTTLLGAHRALKRTGCASLDAWVDTWGLMRVAPAGCLPADVLAYETDDPKLPALALQLSNGRIFGFHPGARVASVVAVTTGAIPLAAWRL